MYLPLYKNWISTVKTDAGAWTEFFQERILIQLIISICS